MLPMSRSREGGTSRRDRAGGQVPERERPYHHGQLREALLSAAFELLADHPARQISLREIARHAGVSHAAPYHYFSDRQQLLGALAERCMDAFYEAQLRAAQQAGVDRVHDRPELGEPVLHRRARERHAVLGVEPADRARRPRPVVLHQLGLVEHHPPERRRGQGVDVAHERPVGGDQEVVLGGDRGHRAGVAVALAVARGAEEGEEVEEKGAGDGGLCWLAVGLGGPRRLRLRLPKGYCRFLDELFLEPPAVDWPLEPFMVKTAE